MEKMGKYDLIEKFYDNIDLYNKNAKFLIKRGEIEKAIKIYNHKIEFIGFACEFEIISFERACDMQLATQHVIDILECKE